MKGPYTIEVRQGGVHISKNTANSGDFCVLSFSVDASPGRIAASYRDIAYFALVCAAIAGPGAGTPEKQAEIMFSSKMPGINP